MSHARTQPGVVDVDQAVAEDVVGEQDTRSSSALEAPEASTFGLARTTRCSLSSEIQAGSHR